MTYCFQIVESSIKLYQELNNLYIIGKERENILITTFKISISTFYNWFFLFNNLDYKDFKNHFINNKRKTKIKKEHIEFIINLVKTDTFIRIKGIKRKITDLFNISISKTSIRNILKKNGITFKKVYKQINPYTEKEHKNKEKSLKKSILKAEIKNVKSVDEFSIHFNEQPKYSWSQKGKQFSVHTKNKNIYGKKYSLCMSVDTSNNINYILKEKSIKADDFNCFIKNIKKNKKTTFLMDNARIHHSKIFKETIKKEKIKVIYGIPYYSKYNPIEYIFSLLRKEIENNQCNNEQDIIKTIDYFIENLSKKTISNIYGHIIKILN